MIRRLSVRVKPGAREDSLVQQADGVWLARVKAPPVDGKANAALIALVAERFGVPKSAVTIKSGAGGRLKLVELSAP